MLSACFLTSCGNEDKFETSGVPSESDGAFPYSGNFGGKTINIFTVNTARHVYGELQFVPNNEKAGNYINDAVAKRNDRIEELYGLKIKVASTANPVKEAKTMILSGLCEYDIIVDSVDLMVTSVTDNLFWSIDEYLDLDNEWWDKNSIDSLTLNDKHYFVAGDALITDDDNIYCTLFNKKMYTDNATLQGRFGDIYQLVKDGKFTYDVFYEMSKVVSHPDENGDWGFNATYGNLSHAYGATIMVNGAGVALASKNEDGTVSLNPGTEKAITVFGKVYKIMSDKSITQRAELIIGQGSKTSKYGFAELEAMFESGRGLFYNTTTSSITILKQSKTNRDFDFGVLPIPKYNESQDRYYCAVNRYQSSVIGIPVTNKDNLETTAFLLEALGYYSKEVTEAYYKITLQLQAVTEDNDADMLDIIYGNRFYDIGAIYGWGNQTGQNLVSLYGSVIANDSSNTIVSTWDSIKDSVEASMQETIEAYQNNLT
jgi:ABC-type glycerol-3-phosphate transport system substrate-binding protein